MISKKCGPDVDMWMRGPSRWSRALQLLDSAHFLSIFSLYIRKVAPAPVGHSECSSDPTMWTVHIGPHFKLILKPATKGIPA
jgi:hypothetical protein